MPKRPSIVLTIADDQRWNTIHALGNPHIQTPFLDALASRGTAFTRAQHGGSTHGAVCAPSRAQLHTGRSLFHTSDALCAPESPVTMARKADQANPLPTLGAQLRQAGYHTCGVGKWHNFEKSFVRSFDVGSRIFFGGMCPHFCVPTQGLKDGALHPMGVPAGHSTDVFSAAACEYLKSRAGDDQPFFLYVAFTAPHDPRETHYRFRKPYFDPPPLPKAFMPQHPFPLEIGVGRDEALAEFPRDPDEIRMHMADYYAMISHLDEGIGRIHRTLEELGFSDDTIVIHTADHGLSVGQHGVMGKQSLYDHSTRVPLLVSGPGFGAGVTDDRLCYQHDLHPTLLASAGIDVTCDYEHLQTSSRRQTVGCAYQNHMRSVRDARWKLIEYRYPDARYTQLFDTVADPDEIVNRADDASCVEHLNRLRPALRQHLAKTDDPLAAVFVD